MNWITQNLMKHIMNLTMYILIMKVNYFGSFNFQLLEVKKEKDYYYFLFAIFGCNK
jgi:hypothetical protein